VCVCIKRSNNGNDFYIDKGCYYETAKSTCALINPLIAIGYANYLQENNMTYTQPDNLRYPIGCIAYVIKKLKK